jgi:hypothetical protein
MLSVEILEKKLLVEATPPFTREGTGGASYVVLVAVICQCSLILNNQLVEQENRGKTWGLSFVVLGGSGLVVVVSHSIHVVPEL